MQSQEWEENANTILIFVVIKKRVVLMKNKVIPISG